jgi:LPXTG-site transpeptidase (sortase) family protein
MDNTSVAVNGSAAHAATADLVTLPAYVAGDREVTLAAATHLGARRGQSTAVAMEGSVLRQFCERLVADALATVRAQLPGVEPPAVDWERIWRVDPSLPPEKMAGHAVVVAQQIASEVLEWSVSRRAPEVSATAPPRYRPPPPPAQHLQRPLPPPPRGARVVLPPPPEPFAAHALVEGTALQGQTSQQWLPPPPAAEQEAGKPGPEDAAEAARRVRRNRRLRRAFVAFGWVRDVGLVLVAFAAWQIWGTSIAQGQAQHTLAQQFQAHVGSAVPPADAKSSGPALISASVHVPEPPEGSVVARLQIPAIGVDQYVVEGTAEGDLAKGPGHYIGTSMPGQAGNVAIAGHRTTYGAPFNNLNGLAAGDPIYLTSDTGERLTYVVTGKPAVVSPKDVSVLNTLNDNRLTLTTCNPRFSASSRLVAVALLSVPQAAAATPVVIPHRVRVVPEAMGWNTKYLPIVFLFALFLIVLALAKNRARAAFGRIGRWLVLTPIWIAGLFFLFDSLTKLLPANL